MNILEKLINRKISFSGWQMPLRLWRRESAAKVPKDTIYLGSFSIRYKGVPTDTYIDIYITESGTINALVYTREEKCWGMHDKEE